jgi:hypothetical protein
VIDGVQSGWQSRSNPIDLLIGETVQLSSHDEASRWIEMKQPREIFFRFSQFSSVH